MGVVGSLQFETPEFAVWHVHELLHFEGWSQERVERTLEDVEPWVPGADELVATLMVDTSDAAYAEAIGGLLAQPGSVVLRAGRDALSSEVVEAGTPSDPVWYLRWRVTPWWHAALSSGTLCAHVAWDPTPIQFPAVTAAALRTDLVETRGASSTVLQRLLERTQVQAHVQPESSCHTARP